MIWLRSTGSTVISQLFDSFIVLELPFGCLGKIDTKMFIASALTGLYSKIVNCCWINTFNLSRSLFNRKIFS